MSSHHNMTAEPIPHLLRSLAVPVGVGFFFNTMFNVVDVFYAGRINTSALAALSLCFPMFFLIVAVGAGLLMGTTALIGHAIGAGRRDEAEIFAAQAFSFALLHALFIMGAVSLAAPWILARMGASGEYFSLAVAYVRALFSGTPFFLGNYVCNAILSATGDTRSFRNYLVGSFLLNLILDPWFVYGGLGLPAMGLPGIAWATVLIQLLGNCYMLMMAINSGLVSGKSWRLLIPRREPFARLFSQGFPASLNMLTVALGIFLITWYLGRFGQGAVAAYGICTRIEQIVILPVMGLNVATLSLVAQNFGAGHLERVRETQRKALQSGLTLMAGGTLAVFAAAGLLIGLFTTDIDVIEAGQGYFRINAFALGSYVVLYVNNAALQGLQKPVFALWIGLFRQLAIPLLLFPLLAFTLGWGLTGIWWGILIVNWSAAVISIIYTRYIMRALGVGGERGLSGLF